MTIKRRLFLSNFLMLVIPIIASVLLSYVVLFLFTAGSEEPLERSFPQMIDIMWRFQQEVEEPELIDMLRVFNAEHREQSILIALAKSGELLYPDAALLRGAHPLLDAALELGASGSITVEKTRIMMEQNGEYQILLLQSDYNPGAVQGSGPPRASHILFLFIGLFAMVLLTNQFLTRMLTKSIVNPLNQLVDGVHQLQEGNLNYRIRYRKKDEFLPVCEDFNKMAAHVQQLIQQQQRNESSRRELLAGISHDLRTPLTSIRAYVEGLLDGVAKDYPTQLKYLSNIRTKAEDIDQMVDKLFLFSKLEMEDFPLSMERLELGEHLRRFWEDVREEYGKKGLEIRLEEPPDTFFVAADPAQLRNAYTNIVENALKYGRMEGGVLAIACGKAGSAVEIVFDDNGPGVTAENLEHLFEVFYRGDASRRHPNRGSGLGLAITRRTMELLGGGIRAENRAGGGLRMVLWLPCAALGLPRTARKEGGETKDEAGSDY